jgi:hypothetical protein
LGITIHFAGKLRDEQCFHEGVRIAREYAAKMQWRCESIDETEVTLLRVGDNEEEWDYTGPVRGIALFPHADCEPVRLEFDRDLYIQEYTKTQFAGPEIHVAVVVLLRALQPLFEKLDVIDESEYWETGDAQNLRATMKRCDEAIADEFAKRPKAQRKVKLPSGRIIDILS